MIRHESKKKTEVVLSTETEVVARFQQLVSAPMQPKFFRNGTLDVNPPRLKVLFVYSRIVQQEFTLRNMSLL